MPGVVFRHSSITCGQRGANGQPDGGSISDGISPEQEHPRCAIPHEDLALPTTTIGYTHEPAHLFSLVISGIERKVATTLDFEN
jgi:hypothetical protein